MAGRWEQGAQWRGACPPHSRLPDPTAHHEPYSGARVVDLSTQQPRGQSNSQRAIMMMIASSRGGACSAIPPHACLLRGRQIAAPWRSGSSSLARMQDVSCAARPSKRPKKESMPLSMWAEMPRPELPMPPADCEAAWLDSQRAWVQHAIEDPVVVQGTDPGGVSRPHASRSAHAGPPTALIVTSFPAMQAPPGAARCTSLAPSIINLSILECSTRW